MRSLHALVTTLLISLAILDVTTAAFSTQTACSTPCAVDDRIGHSCSKHITTPSITLCSALNASFAAIFTGLEQASLPTACYPNATDIFCDFVSGTQDLLENFNDCEFDESNPLPLQFCHSDCVLQLSRLKACASSANSSFNVTELDRFFNCRDNIREFNCMTSSGSYVLSTPEEPVPTATITFLVILLGGLVLAITAILCYRKYCRKRSNDFALDDFGRTNSALSDDLSLSDHDSDQPVFRDTPFDDPENADQ